MKQKNILILGLAKSGIASLELLYNKKNKFYLFDENEQTQQLVREKYTQEKNIFILKQLDYSLLEFINLIVISPSISISTPILVKAINKNIPVISELELGYQYCKNNIIAVTGTNGKTTTVGLINAIFKTANKPCEMVGNIGTPLASVVKKLPRNVTLICEVSSFQLEGISKFAPKECAILNITNDHISRHGSFNEYKKAKFRLFENLKKGSKIVISSEVLNQNLSFFKSLKTLYKVYEIGFKKVEYGCFVQDDNIYFSNGKKAELVCSVTETNLIGNHNLQNIMAAVCFAKFHKINNNDIIKALNNFTPNAHRIQKVYEHEGVTFYDDSKATNTDATIKAVQAFKDQIVLILGGSDKGYEYDEVFTSLPNNVVTILACGEVCKKIEEASTRNNKEVITFKTLKEATIYACQNAKENQIVLLSPASASFDEFANYKDRGEKFLSYIKGYYEN